MDSSEESAGIRARLDGLVTALRAKQVDALMAHYAADMVTFDLRPPHSIDGADAYRRNFEAWFSEVDGPIGYEVGSLRIHAAGDLGISHSVNRVTSKRKGGQRSDYWVRVTSAWRKTGGEWLVVHEHVSLPVHLDSMKAAIERGPD